MKESPPEIVPFANSKFQLAVESDGFPRVLELLQCGGKEAAP